MIKSKQIQAYQWWWGRAACDGWAPLACPPLLRLQQPRHRAHLHQRPLLEPGAGQHDVTLPPDSQQSRALYGGSRVL